MWLLHLYVRVMSTLYYCVLLLVCHLPLPCVRSAGFAGLLPTIPVCLGFWPCVRSAGCAGLLCSSSSSSLASAWRGSLASSHHPRVPWILTLRPLGGVRWSLLCLSCHCTLLLSS